eukprot:TCONS_00072534-protein
MPEESNLLQEVDLLIKDVQFALNVFKLSDILPQSPNEVYVNIETKETEKFTIQLTSQGFKVVAHQFDQNDENGSAKYPTPFETINALLEHISASFVELFGNALKQKLEALQSAQDAENE